ncbi:hypothetical protein LF599_07095 [Pseudodesulfovibrio thermohalotolerans]|uniref:hypothetical protein n=1 Tax=Pseudodesulfovibrio thermohalotolerans TaxID=2880651 RepID=UPI0022B9DA49|nr:hypothetical protein [Pseudodesulfovibrio thermohalotolerans]WFS63922.1 hypothetical protein LF599_07095 [Pseudodesulfovibrio thermohalotolerans]
MRRLILITLTLCTLGFAATAGADPGAHRHPGPQYSRQQPHQSVNHKQGHAYFKDQRGQKDFRHAARPGNRTPHAMGNRTVHRKHPHFRPHKVHRHNNGHRAHKYVRCVPKRTAPMQHFSAVIQTTR